MSNMNSMQDFYYTNSLLVKKNFEVETPESVIKTIQSKGHRYFCIFDQINNFSELSALELGFGSINTANALASVFKSYEAADIAASSFVSGYDINFKYIDADLCNDFPYEDRSFDVVIGMMILEHLFDPFHSFQEIARICKPGGSIFVNLPNITSIRCRWDILTGKMPVTSTSDWFEKRQWDGGHLHYFDIHHVSKLADIYGLKLIKIYPTGKFYEVKKFFPGLFCHEISYVFRRPGN